MAVSPIKMTTEDYAAFINDKLKAGRLTNMGTKILDQGPRQAKHIVTYPWKEKQFDQRVKKPAVFSNEVLQKRRQISIADKLTDMDIPDLEQYTKSVERHEYLHRSSGKNDRTRSVGRITPLP